MTVSRARPGHRGSSRVVGDVVVGSRRGSGGRVFVGPGCGDRERPDDEGGIANILSPVATRSQTNHCPAAGSVDRAAGAEADEDQRHRRPAEHFREPQDQLGDRDIPEGEAEAEDAAPMIGFRSARSGAGRPARSCPEDPRLVSSAERMIGE